MKETIHQFLDREEEPGHIRQDALKRWERYETTGDTVSRDVVDAGWSHGEQKGRESVPFVSSFRLRAFETESRVLIKDAELTNNGMASRSCWGFVHSIRSSWLLDALRRFGR